MGQADGEYRGDTDVILRAAIDKMDDTAFQAMLEKAEEKGILDSSKYKSKLDLSNDLHNIEEPYKEEIAQALREKREFFDE